MFEKWLFAMPYGRPPKPSLYALGVCATGQKQMGPPSCLDDQIWVCAGYAPTNEATPGPKLEVWTGNRRIQFTKGTCHRGS